MKNIVPETYEQCLERHGGNKAAADLVWQSYQKNIDQNYIPDSRLLFALEILELQNAGYPLDRDDLTLEQWKWVGEVKTALQQLQLEQRK